MLMILYFFFPYTPEMCSQTEIISNNHPTQPRNQRSKRQWQWRHLSLTIFYRTNARVRVIYDWVLYPDVLFIGRGYFTYVPVDWKALAQAMMRSCATKLYMYWCSRKGLFSASWTTLACWFEFANQSSTCPLFFLLKLRCFTLRYYRSWS